MPRCSLPWPMLALLVALLALAPAACDDDGQDGEIDLVEDLDTGGADTAPPDDADTAPPDDADTAAPDSSADVPPDTTSDTHTTNLDIPFDIDYDGADTEDTAVPPDTLDTDDPDTSADTADTDDTADADTDTDSDWTGPPTAFDDLDHLRDEALRSALHDRIDDHSSLGYDAARSAMYDTTNGIDVHGGLLECVYTGATVVSDGTNTPGGTFNTEHTWPQSQGASTEPARSDLHHLFPTTQTSNSTRGSIPYGDTACNQSAACTWFQGGSELGPSSVNGTSVFEVRPQRRGDIARAHFYFSVRYQLPIAVATESALRAWHAEDPPDELERARNDAIAALQLNRNPFVDRPDFVGYLADF